MKRTGMMKGGDDERGEWDIGDIAALALWLQQRCQRGVLRWPGPCSATQRSTALRHMTRQAQLVVVASKNLHKVGPMCVGGEPNPYDGQSEADGEKEILRNATVTMTAARH
jgi:hypothetical protein